MKYMLTLTQTTLQTPTKHSERHHLRHHKGQRASHTLRGGGLHVVLIHHHGEEQALEAVKSLERGASHAGHATLEPGLATTALRPPEAGHAEGEERRVQGAHVVKHLEERWTRR